MLFTHFSRERIGFLIQISEQVQSSLMKSQRRIFGRMKKIHTLTWNATIFPQFYRGFPKTNFSFIQFSSFEHHPENLSIPAPVVLPSHPSPQARGSVSSILDS